ncbi:MAG: hypothetical protein CVT95_00385 [Bacteroidetes bacterium HGW-Bacteroidetes-12]|nr:MAG: hypothetical protein CVT95_00385 [Bacteroidetes bacterium HGW-Bacteroidetes-12]
MKKTILSLTLVAVAGFLFNSFTSSEKVTYTTYEYAGELNPLWKDYKSWFRVTHEAPNTGDPTGFLDGKHSGTKAFREIYINKKGEATQKMAGNNKYPAGTVVVKEAYKSKAAWEAKKSPVLTVMVKLENGKAPDTSDWEYYMGSAKKNLFMNFQKFCSGCHVYAQTKDFVFMNADQLKLESK